jgi:hypothetical protein
MTRPLTAIPARVSFTNHALIAEVVAIKRDRQLNAGFWVERANTDGRIGR